MRGWEREIKRQKERLKENERERGEKERGIDIKREGETEGEKEDACYRSRRRND